MPHDPQFTAWLEDMHPRLARFEDFLMPATWTGDHTRDSLAALERHMLDRWPDRASFEQEQDTDFIDGATRYIGETYLRLGGGGWDIDHDPAFVFSGRPFIRLDTEDATPISPVNLQVAVLARRTGQVLAKVWDGQTKNVEERRALRGADWQPARQHVPGITRAPRTGSPEHAAWVRQVPDLLEGLRARADAELGRRLDLTPASLDVLAQLALGDIDAGVLTVGGTGAVRSSYLAHLGSVALELAGGEWCLMPGAADHPNPFVGRPFVERTDADGDPRTALLHGGVDALVQTRSARPLQELLRVYAMEVPRG